MIDHSKTEIVTITEDSFVTKWNHFLQICPGGNFYQNYEWKLVNENHFKHQAHFLAAINSDEVVGIFPFVEIKSHIFGHILCSMPFVNFGGIAAVDQNAKDSLMDEAYRISDNLGVDFLEIRGFSRTKESLPVNTNKISMTLPLADDSDTLWSSFKSKHRTNIRRAYKNNLTTKCGHFDLLDDFYQIMCQSWRSLGTPIYSKSYFSTILETFADRVKIFVTYADKTPIATAFNGHFQKTVEGMWAGSLPNSRKLQPNYVLYWEMMKDACDSGFQEYHLGRSSADSTSESFKKKWNAVSKQLYWEYYLPSGDSMPQINVDNPKYALAIRLWRQLPISATRVIGPLISRSIP
ncbi:MAG: FemAB family XrtA/PEP-CTERM system-associated protein [Candidatus Thiodiazotropha sp.]